MTNTEIVKQYCSQTNTEIVKQYCSQWSDQKLADVLAFSQSDFTTKRAWRIAEVRALAQELNERIPRIAEEDARVPPLPKGLGNVIMAQTGLGPGPWLGAAVRWLEAEVEAGHVAAQLEAETYLAYLRKEAPELLAVAPDAVQKRVPRAKPAST